MERLGGALGVDSSGNFEQSLEARSAAAEDLDDEERFEESEPIYRAIIHDAQAYLQEEGLPEDMKALVQLTIQRANRSVGNCLACQSSQGLGEAKLTEGEQMLRASLAWFRRACGPAHAETLETTVVLAQCLALRGSPQAAELLRGCMPTLITSRHPILPLAQQLLGMMEHSL